MQSKYIKRDMSYRKCHYVFIYQALFATRTHTHVKDQLLLNLTLALTVSFSHPPLLNKQLILINTEYISLPRNGSVRLTKETPILLISTENQNHPLFKLIKRSVTDKDVQDNENKIKLFNIIFQVLSISRVYVIMVLILHLKKKQKNILNHFLKRFDSESKILINDQLNVGLSTNYIIAQTSTINRT